MWIELFIDFGEIGATLEGNSCYLFLKELLNAVTCVTSTHTPTLDFLLSFSQLIGRSIDLQTPRG